MAISKFRSASIAWEIFPALPYQLLDKWQFNQRGLRTSPVLFATSPEMCFYIQVVVMKVFFDYILCIAHSCSLWTGNTLCLQFFLFDAFKTKRDLVTQALRVRELRNIQFAEV